MPAAKPPAFASPLRRISRFGCEGRKPAPAFAKPASAGEGRSAGQGRPATEAPPAPAAGAAEPKAPAAPRFHKGGPDYRPGVERAPPPSLVERFVADLTRDFAEHGWPTIRKLREDYPVQYLKLCADFVSKEEAALLFARSEAAKDPLQGLSEDELLERARRLAEGLGLGAGAHPGKTGGGA